MRDNKSLGNSLIVLFLGGMWRVNLLGLQVFASRSIVCLDNAQPLALLMVFFYNDILASNRAGCNRTKMFSVRPWTPKTALALGGGPTADWAEGSIDSGGTALEGHEGQENRDEEKDARKDTKGNGNRFGVRGHEVIDVIKRHHW
jgi:hypothetical protein